MVKKWDFEAEKYPNKFLEIKYPTLFLFLMAIIGLFQCDPWCLPTQNWLHLN